jgi:hypothetical protein
VGWAGVIGGKCEANALARKVAARHRGVLVSRD